MVYFQKIKVERKKAERSTTGTAPDAAVTVTVFNL